VSVPQLVENSVPVLLSSYIRKVTKGETFIKIKTLIKHESYKPLRDTFHSLNIVTGVAAKVQLQGNAAFSIWRKLRYNIAEATNDRLPELLDMRS